MQLNKLNRKKEKQILKKYKLDSKFRIKKILFNNMISIFENINKLQIIHFEMLL